MCIDIGGIEHGHVFNYSHWFVLSAWDTPCIVDQIVM